MIRKLVDGPALPILAGLLLALAYPPLPFLLLVFTALAPLLIHIATRPAGPAGRWAATRAGLITGGVYFGLQLYWLVVALLSYSLLAIPAYVGAVLVLAGLSGAFAWAVHYTGERLRLPLPVGAAIFWTTLEWIQGHLGDLAFPWLGLGTALAPYPALVGAADLVGSRGLTFLVAIVNGLVAVAVLRYRSWRHWVPALAGSVAVVAAMAGYGFARASSLIMRPVARVAVVQPNIPEDIKLGPAAVDSSLTALTSLTRPLVPRSVHVVVWPEVALPADFVRSDRLIARVSELSDRVRAPILVGAYGVDRDGDPTLFNSAFLVDGTGDSESIPRYDKRRLVPFVERVPFIDPAVLAGSRMDSPYFGGLGRGTTRPLFQVRPGARTGILICYESAFASLARDYRARGADFLVNITNDAWFGRDAWWGRTAALWQHPAHLVLRAVETRAGVARAANTGFSLFVDPFGRVYGATRLFEPDVVSAIVHTTDGTTLFVRWGDWLSAVAVAAAIALVLAAWWRGRPSRRVPGSAVPG